MEQAQQPSSQPWQSETGEPGIVERKEKKRKDYAFPRQFNEKPSIILGCPEGEPGIVVKDISWAAKHSASMQQSLLLLL